MSKKPLGRGLSALIPSHDKEGEEKTVGSRKPLTPRKDNIIEVPVGKIVPNPWQPRKKVVDESLTDLMQSIRERGILLPLIVTEESPGSFQLISGERRFRAARALDLKTVPVIVRAVGEEDKLEMALIENIQRQNLNPIDEACSYEKLRTEFGLSQEDIARKVGKKRSTIANSLRLLTLSEDIQNALSSGAITFGHAKIILGIKTAEKRRAFFQRVIGKKLSIQEAAKETRTRKKRYRLPNPEMAAWEQELGRALATKVNIAKRGKGGKISIEFFGVEELKNIVNRILGNKN